MNFDLRLPIGLMFSIFGALLVIYGIGSDPALYKKSLGINMNLAWGACLLGFGLAMLGFALRARNRDRGASGGNSPKT